MEHFDVVIVGGGPAGSTTATLLAKQGVRVLVLEKDDFPRFHIGESMLPQSYKIWERLGVAEKLEARYLPKYGARFLDCRTERTATYLFAEAFDTSVDHAFQVPRADFDQLLLLHSEECGAQVLHGWEVKSTLVRGDSRQVVGVVAQDREGRRHEIGARVVVDATGRDTLLASRVAVKQKIPGLDKTALFSHYTSVARQAGREEGHIDIIVFPHGWFWNIPFKGEVNSVGVVCSSTWIKQRNAGESLDDFFDRTVADASWARKIMRDARRVAPVRALADYSYRVDRYGGDGWIVVGDGSGFIDPLFSTGAHLAFSSALMASEAIVKALADGDVSASRWVEYERSLRAAAELFAGAVQAFYAGPLQDQIFEQPQRKILRQVITSMLAGDVFKPDARWVSFLREHFPATLPGEDGALAAPGASPMMSS